MEEAVTRKFIHEESSSITSLCAAVDACLSHNLKRRALGLFKTNSTTALLQKVAKCFEPAAEIAQMVAEIENTDPNKRSSSSSDSTNKLKPIQSKKLQVQYGTRYLWIRLALFEKKLSKIVDHLVQNSSKYYEKDALVADPVSGQILASLLVGPCALDYSKMKTQDHYWTDPPADELVQRHRLSSGIPLLHSPATPPSSRRPGLQYRKDVRISGSSEEGHRMIPVVARDYVESLHQNSKSTLLYGKNNVLIQPVGPCALDYSKMKTQDHYWTDPPADELVQRHRLSSGIPLLHSPATPPSSRRPGLQYRKDVRISGSSEEGHRMIPVVARDYVESLHQNSKSTLLYGKNNVLIQPRENIETMPGYLSLHQTPEGLIIKWTPNQLMNGCYTTNEDEATQDKSIYWDYALNLKVDEIVYLHCHQQADSGGTIVLVGQDGVQRPPIHFPKGGHMLAFLSCLENGLLPHGQLDPPLWSQRGKAQEMMDPLTTRGTSSWNSVASGKYPPSIKQLSSSSSSSTSSSKSFPEGNGLTLDRTKRFIQKQDNVATDQSIQILCDTMKRQIISRAFYGWLAHCRHLCTVRTHLSGLVNSVIISPDEPCDATIGLTAEIWNAMNCNKDMDIMEMYRLTYFGGVEHKIRKEVWPYLLGHYEFGSSQEEREQHDKSIQSSYESIMSEWLAVEAIVKQRNKETMAANLAKLSSESTNSEIPLVGPKDTSLSNDVFEDLNSEESFDQSDDIPQVVTDDKDQQLPEIEVKTEISSLILPAESESLSDEIVIEDQNVSIDPMDYVDENVLDTSMKEDTDNLNVETGMDELSVGDLCDDNKLSAESHSSCISPVSSSGGVYSMELLDLFSLNLHRIDKDVQRCDRNYWYFTTENLEKLRNVMCTYVWQHLDVGYMQGMCDLVAPLLVIFDDEVLTYSCFCELMKRMAANFPHGGAMDAHFANMRSLIQILDAEMFELMHQNGDYTHFYFCYRWFLLDFKRELVYDDVFSIWETIWAAKHIASNHFVLFIALAMVEYYRDIILENNMDFTDIIKFFNEMAERHDAKAVLKISRDLVHQIQTLIITNDD
ncbi:small G protein signaling modulator 2-like [Centruroides sculpturatus]|uniref:small G protein signaling modulator 2-like n=1 Tax=Centruroides sculpturatus TaxID=218467 RepID=UPI000C6D831A|nr:small G protein signaling modulator 2-like [Centruroides sculpturatus]